MTESMPGDTPQRLARFVWVVLAVALALPVTGLFGLVMERLSVTPLLGRHHVVFLLSTFGAAVVAENLVLIAFGPDALPLNSPIAHTVQTVGVVSLTQQKIFVLFAIFAAGAHAALPLPPARA